jgi:hypothetical protein
MSLTSDAEIVAGKPWSRRRKIGAALLALPIALYAPGFLAALPAGVATSLPFWAEAADYTCSTSRVRSLMVRVSPYVATQAAPKRGDWDCARIASFSDGDLAEGNRPWLRADDHGQRYVRIYTPFQPARARLPGETIPDDMAERVISLKRAAPKAAANGAPKALASLVAKSPDAATR